MLSYIRTQEEAADRAAVTYLNATGQSGRGLIETFSAILAAAALSDANGRSLSAVASDRAEPYLAVRDARAGVSPHFNKKDSPELQFRHDMVRAKLAGYFDRPEAVARRYPQSNTRCPRNMRA